MYFIAYKNNKSVHFNECVWEVLVKVVINLNYWTYVTSNRLGNMHTYMLTSRNYSLKSNYSRQKYIRLILESYFLMIICSIMQFMCFIFFELIWDWYISDRNLVTILSAFSYQFFVRKNSRLISLASQKLHKL